jgi:hypothetical protein
VVTLVGEEHGAAETGQQQETSPAQLPERALQHAWEEGGSDTAAVPGLRDAFPSPNKRKHPIPSPQSFVEAGYVDEATDLGVSALGRAALSTDIAAACPAGEEGPSPPKRTRMEAAAQRAQHAAAGTDDEMVLDLEWHGDEGGNDGGQSEEEGEYVEEYEVGEDLVDYGEDEEMEGVHGF